MFGVFGNTVVALLNLVIISTCLPVQTRNPRLSIVDWTNYNYHEPEGPGTYAFGYDIQDAETSNVQFRNEERLANGTVIGSYGYVDDSGTIHSVKYIADHLGYRATVENIRRGMLKPIPLPELPLITGVSTKPAGPFSTPQSGRIVTPPETNNFNNNYNNQNSNYVNVGNNLNNFYPNNNQFNKPPYFSNVVNESNKQKENIYEPIWPNIDERPLITGNYNRKYKSNSLRQYVKI